MCIWFVYNVYICKKTTLNINSQFSFHRQECWWWVNKEKENVSWSIVFSSLKHQINILVKYKEEDWNNMVIRRWANMCLKIMLKYNIRLCLLSIEKRYEFYFNMSFSNFLKTNYFRAAFIFKSSIV